MALVVLFESPKTALPLSMGLKPRWVDLPTVGCEDGIWIKVRGCFVDDGSLLIL